MTTKTHTYYLGEEKGRRKGISLNTTLSFIQYRRRRKKKKEIFEGHEKKKWAKKCYLSGINLV